MTTPKFTIRPIDIDRGQHDYDWVLPMEWLAAAFKDTEASPTADGQIELQASKDGSQIILHGHATADVTMPCARTTDPVAVPLRTEIVLVFRPAPAGAARAAHAASAKKKDRKPETAGKGFAPVESKSRKQATEPERELSPEDAAEEFYTGEQIELDDLIREFLILELPMMPLRSDLRSEERPAIPATPESAISDDADSIDPRLRPLAELASRLRNSTKE